MVAIYSQPRQIQSIRLTLALVILWPASPTYPIAMGVQWYSAWPKDERSQVQDSPTSLCCVLEQDTLILAKYWLTNNQIISRKLIYISKWLLNNSFVSPIEL